MKGMFMLNVGYSICSVISPWHIYMVTRCDNLLIILCLTAVVLFFTSVIMLGAYLSNKASGDNDIQDPKFGRKTAWSIMLWFIFTLLAAATPTQKEAAAMYIIPKVVNSGFVQETLPAEMSDMYYLFKAWLVGDSNNGGGNGIEGLRNLGRPRDYKASGTPPEKAGPLPMTLQEIEKAIMNGEVCVGLSDTTNTLNRVIKVPPWGVTTTNQTVSGGEVTDAG